MSTPAPRRQAPAVWVGALSALAVAALGVVLLRDLVVAQGGASGEPWTDRLLSRLDGLEAGSWAVPVGIVLLVAALVMLLWTVLPGRRTHLAGEADDLDLWVAPRVLATMARSVAGRVDGVVDVDAKAGRRRLSVAVTTESGADRDAVATGVRTALTERLGRLVTTSPKISTREVTR